MSLTFAASSGMHLYVTVKNGMTTGELIASALERDAKVYSAERFWFSRTAPEGVVMLATAATRPRWASPPPSTS